MNTIDSSIIQDESARFEYILTPDLTAIARIVVAFLNSKGGTLLIGVTEGTPPRIEGISDAQHAVTQVQEYLSHTVVPRAPVTVNTVTVEERTILVVDVAAGAEPPYMQDGKIYIRHGTLTTTPTPQDIVQMIARRQAESVRWERQPALGITIKDLDESEILQTTREFEKRRLISLGQDVRAVLDTLSLIDGESVCNSAVVLFGKNPARLFPQTRIHLARFEDDSTVINDRVLEGHAFNLIDECFHFLSRYIPIRSKFEGIRRYDTPAFPLTALREAIINAVIHRDYASYTGSIAILLYRDRMEIWNPGTLPKGLSINDLKHGAVSRPHNPDIAYVFYLRGLVERLGTGTRKIIEACKDAGLPDPTWEESGGGIRLTLFLQTSVKQSTVELSERALAILQILSEHEVLSLAEIQKKLATDVSDRAIRSYLSDLVDMGYLKRTGRGRGTKYQSSDKPLSR